ncbi:metallophosphoesterase family protein [soil metagenome]
MTVVLHMSDPHFGTEQPAVADALRRFTHEQSPALLILSGDITQRARPGEFAAARAFVDALGIARRLVIAGNHDIPLFNPAARLLTPYANYCEAFGPELEPVLDTPEVLIIGVKTTRRMRHIDGEVSAQQIERVAGRLKSARAAQLRIVVTHQPVFVINPEDEDDLLHGREPAIKSWAQAGADLILGGHIHRPYTAALHERIAGLPRRLWAVQAGTALSSRIRHEVGNSVNLIRYHGIEASGAASLRRCTVERWDYTPARSAFTLAGTLEANWESAST